MATCRELIPGRIFSRMSIHLFTPNSFLSYTQLNDKVSQRGKPVKKIYAVLFFCVFCGTSLANCCKRKLSSTSCYSNCYFFHPQLASPHSATCHFPTCQSWRTSVWTACCRGGASQALETSCGQGTSHANARMARCNCKAPRNRISIPERGLLQGGLCRHEFMKVRG